MPYALGTRVLRKLCIEQDTYAWQQAKLSTALFKPYEQPVWTWVRDHVMTHHVLPQLETLTAAFPDVAGMETPEPSSYYVRLLENQFYYERINQANLAAQAALKEDQNAHEPALAALRECVRDIAAQKFRLRILDVAKDAMGLVLSHYHHLYDQEIIHFGWPYVDEQFGGAQAGDVVSFIGRPAAGKTWLTLWTALRNWQQQQNILFVSMEMMVLPIVQRITALYTQQNIQQLKVSGFSHQTLQKFYTGLSALSKEQAKFYVMDGNLAANAEDIFALADVLHCKLIFIDGAYLLRHRNARLDRYTRAAENVELIKRFCTDSQATAFCSWQFNRAASQKQKKGHGDQGDLEDIGYSDAIGQISSVVLGLFQDDSIETTKKRQIRVLKGRNGEVGQFSILWDFIDMSFVQCDVVEPSKDHEEENFEWM